MIVSPQYEVNWSTQFGICWLETLQEVQLERLSTSSGGVDLNDKVVMAASSLTLSGGGKASPTSKVAPRLRYTVETGPFMSTLAGKPLT